jgi:hypothetical protein
MNTAPATISTSTAAMPIHIIEVERWLLCFVLVVFLFFLLM